MDCVATGRGQGREALCCDIASVSRQGGAIGAHQPRDKDPRATEWGRVGATRDCRDREAIL